MYYASYEGGLKLPELGKRDRTVYNVLISVTTATAIGGALFLLAWFFVFQGPLEDPDVAGVSYGMSIFGILIFCGVLGLIVSGLVTGRGRKYPIFCEPGVTNDGPVYPLLMPTKDAPEEVRRLAREGRQIALLMAH